MSHLQQPGRVPLNLVLNWFGHLEQTIRLQLRISLRLAYCCSLSCGLAFSAFPDLLQYSAKIRTPANIAYEVALVFIFTLMDIGLWVLFIIPFTHLNFIFCQPHPVCKHLISKEYELPYAHGKLSITCTHMDSPDSTI